MNVIYLNSINQLVFSMGMQNAYCETESSVQCVIELNWILFLKGSFISNNSNKHKVPCFLLEFR